MKGISLHMQRNPACLAQENNGAKNLHLTSLIPPWVVLHDTVYHVITFIIFLAIMMPFPGVFKVFDSHSRDVFGRPSALGYCVLISVEGIENLGEYFRLTSRSNVVIPFELRGVTCIATELSARVIMNSGMVGSTEVFNQHDVNNKISTTRNTRKVRRQGESTEQREARLAKKRKYDISRRENETVEQREARLAKMRKYDISKKQNETAEQRETRLAKKRERVRAFRKRSSSQKQGERKGSHKIEEDITRIRRINIKAQHSAFSRAINRTVSYGLYMFIKSDVSS